MRDGLPGKEIDADTILAKAVNPKQGKTQDPSDARHEMGEHADEDLSGVDWYGDELRGRRFLRCSFVDAALDELTTYGCVFEDCDLSGVSLTASVHEDTAFLRCRFRKASLFGATLRRCKLTGSVFESAVLRPLTVDGGDWSYVSLRGQSLAGLRLAGVRLREADLTDADISGTDLSGADLAHARVHGLHLAGSDLRGADLDGVDLRGLDLRGVHLDLAQAVMLATQSGAEVD